MKTLRSACFPPDCYDSLGASHSADQLFAENRRDSVRENRTFDRCGDFPRSRPTAETSGDRVRRRTNEGKGRKGGKNVRRKEGRGKRTRPVGFGKDRAYRAWTRRRGIDRALINRVDYSAGMHRLGPVLPFSSVSGKFRVNVAMESHEDALLPLPIPFSLSVRRTAVPFRDRSFYVHRRKFANGSKARGRVPMRDTGPRFAGERASTFRLFRARDPARVVASRDSWNVAWNRHGASERRAKGERGFVRIGRPDGCRPRPVAGTDAAGRAYARSNYPVGLREQIAVAVIINQD